MIRNLGHALVGVALILVTGWVVGQPAIQKQMAGHADARYAVLGVLAALAVFVLASVVRAFKGSKPKTQARSSSPYAAATAKRGK